MARKKQEATYSTGLVEEFQAELDQLSASTILSKLEEVHTQEAGGTVQVTNTKLRNQVVISLLDTAGVYMLKPDTDEAILRSRVQSLIKIADTVVDELEKKHE